MVGWTISLLGDGFWTKIKDFLTGIFAIIPQFIYFFYTCIASVLDVLQYLLRKLAGLDVYYVNGVKTNGDILSQLINSVLGINGEYSALNTVFWSMMIFGVILLIVGVIISIIKAHYNYDEKKARPSFIIGKALKSASLMAIVPIVTIFGVYLSNIFLKALDSITSSSSVGSTAEVFSSSEGNYQTVFEMSEDEWGNPTYVSYDFFGSDAPTGTVTISGTLFKAAANSCNRVRYGGYTAADGGASFDPADGKWSNCGIFSSTLSSPSEQQEAVAYMIDYAFANNLRLNERQTASILKSESLVLVSSFKFLQSSVWYAGTINFKSFSKFNVGLVWYYYNLWQFNFLVAFIGVIVALIFISNVVFGLMVRLLECTALMICLGPVIGISPLEDGTAFKEWRKTFMTDVLSAYGAIGGMNLSFMLLPHLKNIKFFTSSLLNSIMEMMLIIVLLIAIKQIVGLISGFVGGGDAAAIGSGVKNDVAGAAKQGGDGAAKAATLAVKIAKLIPATKAVAVAADKLKKKIAELKKKAAQKLKLDKLAEKIKNSKPVSFARRKYDELKTSIFGEGDDISEEEHDKLVAEEEANLTEEKDNNIKTIEETEGAADRTSAENRAKAAELDREGDINNVLDDSIKEDFKQFLDSSVTERDFERYMASKGKNIAGKDIGALATKLKRDRNNAKYTRYGRRRVGRRAMEGINAPFIQNFEELVDNRSADALAEKRSKADALRAAADAQDRNQAIDARLADMHTEGFTLEGKRVIRSAAPKGIGKIVAQLNGEVFKAVNAELGLDEAFKDLDKSTAVVDSARIILRDFAQQLGAQVTGVKAFQTNEEQDKAKKRAKQEKLVDNSGVTESQSVVDAVKRLTDQLKKMRIIS